jgi:hypothetical protein
MGSFDRMSLGIFGRVIIMGEYMTHGYKLCFLLQAFQYGLGMALHNGWHCILETS